MITLVAGPVSIKATGPYEKLAIMHEAFSYKNKAAQYSLRRFDRMVKAKLRSEETFQGFEQWAEKKRAAIVARLKVYACVEKPGELRLPIGLLPSALELLLDCDIPFKLNDTRDFDLDHKLFNLPPLELRRPQREALDIVKALKGHKRGMGLIKIATAVGKTSLGERIIDHFGVPSLFLVPSTVILKQTVKRFQESFGRYEVGAYGGGKKKHNYITVATYQSVFKADPKDFAEYKLALYDEVHHIAAETFYEVGTNKLINIHHRYGLTADEERADGGTILVEAAAGPTIYEYDAAQGIEDKYLARPTFMVYDVTRTSGSHKLWKIKKNKRVEVGVEQSSAYQGPDLFKAYKNWVLGNDLLNEKVAELTRAFAASGKNVLILIDEKEHGEKLMEKISDIAEVCYGGAKDNEKFQERFNARELKVLLGTSTLGEGADTVAVDVLINLYGGLRPKQQNGRALRNENGLKMSCLIIDFNYPNHEDLSRHSRTREEEHKKIGIVHHSVLI